MNIELLEQQARAMFRTVGPRVTAADDENVAIRHCQRCTPPPKVFECYLCTFACQERWQYDLHVMINPENCQRYARKWAQRYAENHS